jgi:hypothetical protein
MLAAGTQSGRRAVELGLHQVLLRTGNDVWGAPAATCSLVAYMGPTGHRGKYKERVRGSSIILAALCT